MATHDYVIANGTGAAVRSDLNNALAAIVSNNSSSSEPSTTYAYQFWADTNANVLKIRNSANNAWITLRELDGTMLVEDGTAAAPGLSFASDKNTGIFRPSDNELAISANGNERISLSDSSVIINQDGDDVDFRVESDTNTHMLFVNAGTNRVGIGQSSPNATVHVTTADSGVNPNASADELFVESDGDTGITIGSPATGTGRISFGDPAGVQVGKILYDHSSNFLSFDTASSEALRINNGGKVLVNTTSVLDSNAAAKLQVQESTGALLALGRDGTGVTAGDDIGKIAFYGNDAGSYQKCAQIKCEADGSHADNDKPSRLVFATTSDGASSPTERLRIAENGLVGIGTTSPDSYYAKQLVVDTGSAAQSGITIVSNSSNQGMLAFADGTSGQDRYRGFLDYNHSNDSLAFGTNGGERARITASSELIVGKTTSGVSDNGGELRDGASDYAVVATAGGHIPLIVNRNTNDGGLIKFRQANSDEGTISVSGSTVSYNGAHLSRWSQLAGGAQRTEILRGSVLSNLDEMCEWAHAAQDAVLYTEEDELPEGASVGDVKTPAVEAYTELNEQLNRMKVSDVEGDANVAGVFQNWDDDDDTYINDFYCAMTGDFIIRIAQGTTVARGDLLMSAGDGTAKPQDDDIVRSKTIAKVTSTTVSTTYSDGSYCIPCVLMAC